MKEYGLPQRLKEGIFFIPKKHFLILIKDKTLKDSAILLVVTFILSYLLFILEYLAFESGTFDEKILKVAIYPVAMVIWIIYAYITYSIEFLLLKLIRGEGTLTQSIAMSIYTSTAFNIFYIVPFLGILGAMISFINLVRGQSVVHKLPVWQVGLVLFFWRVASMVLLFALVILGYVLLKDWGAI